MGGGWGPSLPTSKPSTPLASGGNSPHLGGSPIHQHGVHQHGSFQGMGMPRPSMPAPQMPGGINRTPQMGQQTFGGQAKSNYARSNFDNLTGANGKEAPKPATCTFDDLLGSQGFNFSSAKENSAPKTMSQMKQAELVKSMDPNTRKVSANESFLVNTSIN